MPYIYCEEIKIDHQLFYDLLDKLFVSLLITVGTGTFLFWLIPKNKLNAQMKILQPIDISETIINARVDTEKWYFNGGSGHFSRSQTLPSLAKQSREKNKEISIIIIIINPLNTKIIEHYVDYKNSLRTSAKREKKTIKSVQLDLISTIVSCFIWQSEQPLLNISLYLKESYSLFRTDLSSSKVIITKEDPIEPAILYEKGTFFYLAQLEEFKQITKQNQKITIEKFKSFDSVTKNDIKKLLIDLNLISVLNEVDLNSIETMAKSNKNPYE